ncbi:pimeloyl-[acyl-carrier protein] methyl ester esterase, partial [bacterium M00.F.Ca.ET.228.01.1.1]
AMQAAAALAPGAQALTIAHGGHAPFLGHADEVASALQHFVAGLSPVDGGQ